MKKSLTKFVLPVIALLMSVTGCLPSTEAAPDDGWTDVIEDDMADLVGKWVSKATATPEIKMSNPEGMICKIEYPSITINFYNYKEDKKVITRYQPEYDYVNVYYKAKGTAFTDADKAFLNKNFSGGSYNNDGTVYKYKKTVASVEQIGIKMIYLKRGINSFMIDKSRMKIQIDGMVYIKSGEADKAPVEPGNEDNDSAEEDDDNVEDLSNIQWPVRYEVDLGMREKTTLVFYEDKTVTVEMYDETKLRPEITLIIEAIAMEGTYEGNPDPAKNHTVDLEILRITDRNEIASYWLKQTISNNPVNLTFEASKEFLHDATDEEKANLPYQVIIKDGIIASYN